MKSFEEKLIELEGLSESIRSTDLPLESMVENFDRGIKLARELEKELNQIERKIEILINEPEEDESPELQLFQEEDLS